MIPGERCQQNCCDGEESCCDDLFEGDRCEESCCNIVESPPSTPKSSSPKHSCCFEAENGIRYCFYAPNDSQSGQCYRNPTEHTEDPLTKSSFAPQFYTGAEQTDVGLAGGGEERGKQGEGSCNEGCCKGAGGGGEESRGGKKQEVSCYEDCCRSDGNDKGEVSCERDCCGETSQGTSAEKCCDNGCCEKEGPRETDGEMSLVKNISFKQLEASCGDDCCKEDGCREGEKKNLSLEQLEVEGSCENGCCKKRDDEMSCVDDCCKENGASFEECQKEKESCCDKGKCSKPITTSNSLKKECSQGCCENEISENEPTKPVPKENFSTTSKTVQLCIEGMDCNGCAVTLENHLKKLPGVNMVQTSVLTGISVVYYEPLITTPEKIVDHINLSSLTASISADSTAFNVVLMNTVDANEVMEFLEGIVGVLSVKRNDSKEDPHRFHFLVNYNPSKIGVRTVLDMLKEQFVDFAPDITKIVKRNYQNDINNERNLKMKFWASLILTIPIIISAWILPATFGEYNKIAVGGLPVKFLVNWVFASPIQLFLALPIYESCYSAARYAHDANMDTLIALSTTIAYLYSVGISTAILIIGSQSYSILHETFFETSSLVITLVLLGRYLENYTKRQTSSSLSKLMELQPETAILYSGDVEIPFYMIQRGDILKVLPGTKIPTDGIVVTGKTSIDESILTGESLPVKKEPNSILYGGTLNTEGMITMKVTRVPGETELDSIARQLENTQMNKAKIESITDKISSKFVFVILLIALVVFIIWLIIGLLGVIDLDDPVKSNSTNSSSYDSTSNAVPFSLNFALAVLIVSCPCAIGLAAPTAVLVGAGVAAKKFQILFKGGDTIEQCAKVNTICFDKTGTLTEGKLKLIDVKIKKTKKIRDKESFLFYVASAEVASEHPIGKSVVKYYKQQLQENILLPSLETPLKSNITPGKGIEASLKDSTKIHVGSASFLKEELNLQIPQKFLKQAESHQNRGAIVVFAAIDGKFSGLVAVSDTVKETSLEVIQMLNKEGYEIWMVTGDYKITAQVIANQLGIQNYIAEVSPGEKATFIKDLQEKGRKVVMLGDGVNDAVALSQSNVGIAVGKAADLSVEVADIILLTDNLKHLLIALDLSKTIYNRIKINLVWAFGYNIIMIPLAAGVFYYPGHVAIPPAFAGLSDLLSSVPVIIFSLLLHYYNPTLLKPNKTKSKSVVDIV